MAFISIADQWLRVWKDAQEINHLDKNHILSISSVGSISTYILPAVFHRFSQSNPDVRICFHNYHSLEAYQYVNTGTNEIAFISDDMYHKSVETIPAFKEPMVLIANESHPYGSTVHPSELNPEMRSACHGIRNLIYGMIFGSNHFRPIKCFWTR